MSEYPMYRKRKTLNGVEYVKIISEERALSVFVGEDTWYKGTTINIKKIDEMHGLTIIPKHEFDSAESLINTEYLFNYL